MANEKTYLGDGVYAERDAFDPGGIVLTTENGVATTNRIVMEPTVLLVFEAWLARRRAKAAG